VSKLEIRIFGDPVLRQRAHVVEDFDGRLADLAANMFDTMRAADGVGLAANQVGVLKRLFTWEVTEETPEGDLVPRGSAVVNPELVSSSEEIQHGDEGCLSFPGLFYPVDRPLQVVVGYHDLGGEHHEAELEGFLARVWLHEMDHLNGILFIDHLAKHDRQAALKAMREQRLDAGVDDDPRPGGLLLGRNRG
jgi:peptide deformylase